MMIYLLQLISYGGLNHVFWRSRRFYDWNAAYIKVFGSLIRRADANYNSRNNNIVYQNRNKAPKPHYIEDIQFQCPVARLMFQPWAADLQIPALQPSLARG
jgi:hypothetical protein